MLQAAAATIAEEQLGDLTHDCELVLVPGSGCTCGELDRARRAAGLRHDQLLARALGEVMTDRLSNGDLGTHHGVAPHITIVSDITDVTAPLVGGMTVPGTDAPALVPDATMHRLLCDADITRVLTTTLPIPSGARDCASSRGTSAEDRADASLHAVTTTLTAMARSVL